MADESDKVEPSAPTCLADPNFAIICSFLDKFSDSMGISTLPFTQLQEMLEEQDQVHPTLIDLHVKLLRKARKYFTVDKWEKTLIRFARSYSQQDGWELERFGYKKASLVVKIRLLKILLETQFDLNVKFKNEINKLAPKDLRIEPLGKDKDGFLYWCQFDATFNVRVYKEDTDEETWDLVASDRNGLVTLIDGLSQGEGQNELQSILNAEEMSDEAGKTANDDDDGEVEEQEDDEVDDEEDEEDDDEDEEEEEDEDGQLEEKEESRESEIKEETKTDQNIERMDTSENTVDGVSSADNSDVIPKISEGIKPDAANTEESKDVCNTVPESEKKIVSEKPSDAVEDLSSSKEYKETVTNNGSIDLCVNKSLPTKAPPPRPGSKLEEIFKTKIERSMCSYPDDKTSILSQMAARFNSPSIEAEDLTVNSAKKPRLDKEYPAEVKTNSKADVIVGEAIEEKLMVVQGEGSGADCNAGNPIDINTTSSDSSLDFVAVLNGSTKEAITEALKNCIIRDSAKDRQIPSDCHKLDAFTYTDVEKDLLSHINRLNHSTTYNEYPVVEHPSRSKAEDFVFEASEEIVEEVMYFSGCGAGHECETGNSSDKPSTSDGNVDVEKKATKKLWSIDTICKTTNETKNPDSESKIANGPTVDKTTKDTVAKTDNAALNSESVKPVDECKPKSDSSKPVKPEEKGKKSVLLSNIIEVCLNNNSSVKDNCNKEIPLGSKYQDLFSAKNILGPSENCAILTCNSSGKKSTNSSSKTELENKANKVAEGVSDSTKFDSNDKCEDSNTKAPETKVINEDDGTCKINVEKTLLKEGTHEEEEPSKANVKEGTHEEDKTSKVDIKVAVLKEDITSKVDIKNILTPKEETTSKVDVKVAPPKEDTHKEDKTSKVDVKMALLEGNTHKEDKTSKIELKVAPTKEDTHKQETTPKVDLKIATLKEDTLKEDITSKVDVKNTLTHKEETLPKVVKMAPPKEDTHKEKTPSIDHVKLAPLKEDTHKGDKTSKVDLEKARPKEDTHKGDKTSKVDVKNTPAHKEETPSEVDVKIAPLKKDTHKEDKASKVEAKLNPHKEDTLKGDKTSKVDVKMVPLKEDTHKDRTSKVDVKNTPAHKEETPSEVDVTIAPLREDTQKEDITSKVEAKLAPHKEDKMSKFNPKKCLLNEKKPEVEVQKMPPNVVKSDIVNAAKEKLDDATGDKKMENLKDALTKSEDSVQEKVLPTTEKSKDEKNVVEEKSNNQNSKDSIRKTSSHEKKPTTEVPNHSSDIVDIDKKADKDAKEAVPRKNELKNKTTEETENTVVKPNKPQIEVDSTIKPLDDVDNSETNQSSDVIQKPTDPVLETTRSEIDETQKTVKKSDNEVIKTSKVSDSNLTRIPNDPTTNSNKTAVPPTDSIIDVHNAMCTPDIKESSETPSTIADSEKSSDKAPRDENTEIVETEVPGNDGSSIERKSNVVDSVDQPVKDPSGNADLVESKELAGVKETPKADDNNGTSVVKPGDVYVRVTRMKTEEKEDSVKSKSGEEEPSTVEQVTEERENRRSTRRSSAAKPPLPVRTPKGRKQAEKVTKETISEKNADSISEKEETKTVKPVKEEPAEEVASPKVGEKRKREALEVVKSEEESDKGDEANCKSTENEVGGKKPKMRNRGKRCGKRSRKRPGGNAKNVKSAKKENEVTESRSDEKDAGDVDDVNVKTEQKAESPKAEEQNESDDDVPLAKRGRSAASAPKSEKNEPAVVKKRRCPKKPTVLGLTETDLKSVQVVPLDNSGSGMRASRRIAMQKIKEEADRRAVEEAIQDINKTKKTKGKDKTGNKKKDANFTLDKPKKDKSKGKQRKGKSDSDDDMEGQGDEKKDGKKKQRKRGFKYNINKPWASSSDDDDENLEEEEEDHLEFMGLEDEDEKSVSDHEFSCDEDLEKGEGEILPVRRARTAVKEKSEDVKQEEEAQADEDYKCEKCSLGDHPEWILLCDTCDKGYHASCLRPPLMLIPEGDWHCPVCQNAALVKKLKQVLRKFEQHTKRRENEELRRKRLAYVGISLANVLPENAGNKAKKPEKMKTSSGSSGEDSSSEEDSDSESSEDSEEEPVYQLRQRRSAVQSYRFNDYDQLIDSAIQDEMVPNGPEALPPVNSGNNEPIRLAENGEAMEPVMDTEQVNQENDENNDEDGDSKTQWLPSVASSKSQVPFGRKKPKKLCNLDVESDDQNDSDEDFKGSSSDEEEDDYSNASDESGDYRRSRQPLRRSGRARHSRVDKDFINDDSDESYSPKKKKKKQVWDESESSSDSSWGRRKKRGAVRTSFPKSRSKSKKKKKGRSHYESDSDVPKKKPRAKKPKVRYGMSEDDDDGPLIRTRGKKMNYTEIHGSDTEEEERINRIKGRKTLSDMEAEDEEFVLDQDEEEEFMKTKTPVKKGGPRRISSDDESDLATESKGKDEKAEEAETSKEASDEGESEEETKIPVTPKPSVISKPEVATPAVPPPAKEPQPNVEPPVVRPKIVPIATQRLLAPRPPPTRLPYTSLHRPIGESDEDEMEDEEEEELEEEEMIPEDEMIEEDEGKSDEDQFPPRKMPPPIPSLRLATPPRPPAVGLNAIQSKLKEALNASNERKPRESEALAKLREKLAAAASRPNPTISILPVANMASNSPNKIPPSTASKVLPFPSSPTPKGDIVKTEEKDKQVSPTPVINSIRVVNTQKLLAHPQHQPELLKRNRPDVPSVIRGMLSPGQPPGSSLFYNRGGHQRLVCPPGMDPTRFMQQRHPLLHPPPHLQQQRRFPDRYLYGPGAVYHPGVGGFYPTPPGPTPAAAYQHDVGSSEFRESPSPAEEELHYQNPGPASGPQPPASQPSAVSEGRGEFGGLVSYFSSQREEDGELET